MFLTILAPLPLVAPVNVTHKEVVEDGFLGMTVTAPVKEAVQSPVISDFPHDGIEFASSHATNPVGVQDTNSAERRRSLP